MHKIKVLLLTALCGFILGFVIFSHYYKETLVTVTEKAFIVSAMMVAVPFSWYVLSFFLKLIFTEIARLFDEDESKSNDANSSNFGCNYTSGGDSDSGG